MEDKEKDLVKLKESIKNCKHSYFVFAVLNCDVDFYKENLENIKEINTSSDPLYPFTEITINCKPMSKTLEYKDKSGEWRLTHKSSNGNITLASTEGYKNKKDMQESMINACIETLEYFLSKDKLSEKQEKDILVLALKVKL